MFQYGQASAPAAKRYVGRRKSIQGRSMQNGIGITANCITAFLPLGVSGSSRWSECLICHPTPKYRFALHQEVLQLHRRPGFQEFNLFSGISSSSSHHTTSSQYTGTATYTTSSTLFSGQERNRLIQPGVVADLTRLQEPYRATS
jgi:hypothetical protein